ncbi:DUF2459 domain-containing protein [Lacibacter sp. H407]|uniref:DUF2459 domain-containing protein n=1 Tax=Lacibacter sp. H407 TaxID=3133423 RepID=UPI0030C13ECD
MQLLKRFVRLLLFFVQLLADLLLLYVCFALIGCFWPRNKDEIKQSSGIPLLIHGDGFHTELYLPVEDSLHIINWMDWFDDSTMRSKHSDRKLISFAWADEDWMTEVAQKRAHRVSTIAEIMLKPGNSSVMHIQWRDTVWPLKLPVTVKRFLSFDQYLELIDYIQSGFVTEKRKPVIQSYKGFYGYDYFYRSTFNYNLFTTCNQWTGNALHACGIRTALFSPFGWSIFYQLKK